MTRPSVDVRLGPWLMDEAALEEWGERIGREVERPIVIALSGELGTGKSVLARAVARGAGVAGPMPSPTFNLLYRYETDSGTIVHIDLYRLTDAEDVWELGWRDLASGPDEIVMIEWPERAADLLPWPRWEITLTMAPASALVREVAAVPFGDVSDLPLPG
ncbi:MAG TPA: tRNA (adenosine(37)-N6)-threonylcarbamoyltransferase complex ATPase subunit type 1 TsaE [Burkholderiales bacterium]|nr:tRNA (adenosine(37)-N6)-threonylcarbamoyltransferase complex ATPase subunit type 1 TsaE [Burkholderiales bacterium]